MLISEDGTLLARTEKALAGKGFKTTRQFLDRLPYKLIDHTKVSSLVEAVEKDAAIKATYISHFYKQGRPSLIKATLKDSITGLEFSVVWFGLDWMERVIGSFKSGESVLVCGYVKHDSYGYSIAHPSVFESLNRKSINDLLGMKPQYRSIRGVSAEMETEVRKHFLSSEEYSEDSFDEEVREKLGLVSLCDTYKKIHFPKDAKEYQVGMNEYDLRQLLAFSYALKNLYTPLSKGIVLLNDNLSKTFESIQPFKFTEDQKKATEKIAEYAKEGKQMRLLVQGDVGCGKTAVAIFSLLLAVGSYKQAVLTAPTNVLALQHYNDLMKMTEAFKERGLPVNVQFISSGMKAAEKREAQRKIESGEVDIIVGTHATFSAGYKYKDLALIVVDEEHRFGVAQRDA